MSYKLKTQKKKEASKSYSFENDYDAQANKFMKDTDTSYSIKLLKHDKYFSGDTQARDIYKFKITKDGKTYEGTFGQSITDSKLGVQPRAYEILSSLSADDGDENESFEDFADNYGYEHDDKQAKKTYRAVIKERKGIHNLYSEAELDKLHEIQ